MADNKNTAMQKETPSFVYRDGMTADKEYVEWLSEVKVRFRQNQVKASVRVNTSMLEFYWSIGRDLVALKAEQRWGAGIVKQFSMDMRQAFPNVTGFSLTNVKYMKQWYSFYYEHVTKGQQAVGQIDASQKSQQVIGQLEMPENFGHIPWGQHVDIVSQCTNLEEAFFYINKVATEGWSRSFLEEQLKANVYTHQGTAITNFDTTLPEQQSEMAKELLKDEYNFEFLTMKARYDEHDLEDALVANITRFLLELGKGFAFVGRQMELCMDEETTFFPDLIFYHIPQKRYVVIELKAVKFMPEFAGKINFYVTAADKLLRGKGDNPSVGLIICKTAKKTLVEWSFDGIEKPMGVATYQLQEVVERTIAEIESRNKGMEQNR